MRRLALHGVVVDVRGIIHVRLFHHHLLLVSNRCDIHLERMLRLRVRLCHVSGSIVISYLVTRCHSAAVMFNGVEVRLVRVRIGIRRVIPVFVHRSSEFVNIDHVGVLVSCIVVRHRCESLVVAPAVGLLSKKQAGVHPMFSHSTGSFCSLFRSNCALR